MLQRSLHVSLSHICEPHAFHQQGQRTGEAGVGSIRTVLGYFSLMSDLLDLDMLIKSGTM